MFRSRLLIGVLALAIVSSGGLLGDDTKKSPDSTKTAVVQKGEEPKKADNQKDPPVKLRGQLPAGWRRLGLDEKQVQAIYKIQHDYRGKIDDLEQQIKALKKQERDAMEKVLTAAQKARLKELNQDK
jgi:hypothetical protein